MTLISAATRQSVRLRFTVFAFTGLGLAALMLAGAALMVHAGYRAFQEQTRPVSLMAMDDPAESAVGQALAAQPVAPLTVEPAADDSDAGANPGNVTLQPPAPAPSRPAIIRQAPARAPRSESPMFDGRPIRKVGSVRMLITAYSPDKRSCGPNARGITASGMSVWTNAMQLVAADTRLLPFGSLISVPGYHGGKPVPVLDRGGAIKGRRIDVLFPTHEQANAWGKRYVTITVWDYAD